MSQLYLVTARKRWFYIHRPYRTRYAPVRIDADTLDTLTNKHQQAYLDNLVASRRHREPILMIGTAAELMERLHGLDYGHFSNAQSVVEDQYQETSNYIEAVTRALPNPTYVLTSLLERMTRDTYVELYGMKIGYPPKRAAVFRQYTGPRVDLEVYTRPDQFLSKFRALNHIPSKLRDDALARQFLLDLMMSHLGVGAALPVPPERPIGTDDDYDVPTHALKVSFG